MQIWSGLTGIGPAVGERTAREGRELRKADHVADLFNHRPAGKDERRSARVHLSQGSQMLQARLRQEVVAVLKSNSALSEAVREIPLPNEAGEGKDQSVLALRRVRAYLQWRSIDGEPTEADAPYIAVEEADTEDQLSALFQQFEEQRQALQQQRQGALPNYYYLVYPETYAFN